MTPADRDPLAEARRLKRRSDCLWWDAIIAWGVIAFVVAMLTTAVIKAGS